MKHLLRIFNKREIYLPSHNLLRQKYVQVNDNINETPNFARPSDPVILANWIIWTSGHLFIAMT